MFLGIDPSLTGTGIAIIKNDYTIEFLEKLTTDAFGVERLFLLENSLKGILDTYRDKIELCCYESPAYNATGKLVEIGEWYGVFKLVLFRAGIQCFSAAPLQLKQYCTGEGKSFTKSVIMLNAYKNFGVEFDDDNKCDAYILSRMARDYVIKYKKQEDGSIEHLFKYHHTILDKLHKQIEIKKKKSLL